MAETALQPLEFARRVLRLDTLEIVGREPYNARGWKILDRWALDSPEELKCLEADRLSGLLDLLLEQQALEERVLLELAGHLTEAQSDIELLQGAGVGTGMCENRNLGELATLKAQHSKDADAVAEGRRTARGLMVVGPGDLDGVVFTPSRTSEYDMPGEGW
jgi:hypothetical protein